MQTNLNDRRRIRREIIIPPTPRAPRRTTARGRLMLPKPRTKRQTRREWESRHGVPKSMTETTADWLLGEIIGKLHVVGPAADPYQSVELEMSLPEHVFRALCLFGAAIEDLELECDCCSAGEDAGAKGHYTVRFGDVADDSEDAEESDPPEDDDPGGGNVEDEGEDVRW